jgi:hypothetical protein
MNSTNLAIDLVEYLVDGLVFLAESVEHRAELGIAGTEVGKDRLVVDAVVCSGHPAVGRAVGAECPVVLPQGHLVDRRTGATGLDRAVTDLVDEIAQPAQLVA